MFIPFLLCPIVLSTVAYGATALGLVSPVTQNVTWVMPPVLYMDSLQLVLTETTILSLINLGLAIAIYLPLLNLQIIQNLKIIKERNRLGSIEIKRIFI